MAGETNQVLDDLELNLDIETITLDDIEINELDEETESENINIDNEDLNNIKLSEVSIDGNNLEIEGPGMEPVISEPEPPVQPADDEFQDENVAIPGEENIGAMETLNIIGNTPEPEIENHEEAMSQEEKERIEQEEKLAFKESTALEDAYTFENDDEIVSIDGSDLDRIIYGDSSNEYSPDENFQLNIDDTEEIDNDISDVELISEPTDVFISEEDADRPKSESQDTIPELDFDLSVIPDVVEVDDDDSPIALSMEELNNIEVYEKVDEDAAEVSSEEGVDFGIPDEETVSFEDEPIVDEVEPPAETIDISFEDDFIPSQDEISDEMQAIQLEPVIDEEPLEVSAGETPDFGIPDEETVSFEDEPVVDEVEPPAETVDISFEDDFIPSQDEISDEMQAIQLEPVIDEETMEAPEDLISEEVEIVEVHDEMIDLPQEPTIISEPLHSSVTHAETPELVEKGALHEEKSQTELTDHAMMEEEIEISETNFEEIAKLEEFEESEGIQETEFESINIKEPSMESALIEPQAEEEIPSFEEPDLAIGETEEIETGISTEVEVYEEEFVPPPVEDVVAIDESELQPEFPDTEFDEAQFEEVVQEEDHVEIAVDELNEIQTGLSNETVAPEMYGLEEPETQIEKEISLPKFEEPEPLSVEQKEQVIESKVDSLSDETKTEIKKVLKYLDNLLDDLPEEKIKAFSQSEYYDLYIKIMDKLGV